MCEQTHKDHGPSVEVREQLEEGSCVCSEDWAQIMRQGKQAPVLASRQTPFTNIFYFLK